MFRYKINKSRIPKIFGRRTCWRVILVLVFLSLVIFGLFILGNNFQKRQFWRYKVMVLHCHGQTILPGGAKSFGKLLTFGHHIFQSHVILIRKFMFMWLLNVMANFFNNLPSILHPWQSSPAMAVLMKKTDTINEILNMVELYK